MDNFTKAICPKCKSEKFKNITDDLIFTCTCGLEFNPKKIEFITGKQANDILNITTRQGLHSIVKKHDITKKSNGAGKPNTYLKSDVEKVAALTNSQREKTNPNIRKTIATKKNKVENKKKTVTKNIESKHQDLAPPKNNLEDEEFTPLNKIGQDEFLRVEQKLKDMGTYEDVDRSLLLFYAISYQKYINAVTQSAMNDDVTMNDLGDLKVHPHFQIADKCFTHMSKLAVMMGIGTRNRMGLEIKKEKKEGILDRLNKKRKWED